jgi:NADP-dependent 3-hydroxy acid dehydrogenase YdfG
MPSIDDSKCILVTGATSGIGRALAIALAKLPSKPRVVAVGRRKDRLEELAKSGLETVEFDMNTDSPGLKNFADIIVQKYPEVSYRIVQSPMA